MNKCDKPSALRSITAISFRKTLDFVRFLPISVGVKGLEIAEVVTSAFSFRIDVVNLPPKFTLRSVGSIPNFIPFGIPSPNFRVFSTDGFTFVPHLVYYFIASHYLSLRKYTLFPQRAFLQGIRAKSGS